METQTLSDSAPVLKPASLPASAPVSQPATLTDLTDSAPVSTVSSMEQPRKNIAWTPILILVTVCVVLTVYFASIAFRECKAQKFGKCEKDAKLFDVWKWLNGDNVSLKSIAVGMTSGVVFGFVDNAGLFLGMEALDSVFEKLPFGKEANVKSGYGNTFSDMVGAFMSTFIGRYITYKTGITEYPMWSEAIGVFVGCLLGILIPRIFISPS